MSSSFSSSSSSSESAFCGQYWCVGGYAVWMLRSVVGHTPDVGIMCRVVCRTDRVVVVGKRGMRGEMSGNYRYT